LIRDAGDGTVDGCLEVGVVEDDERGLAAELEVHALAGGAAVQDCATDAPSTR
jgi:hypothetical protein